MKRDSLLVDIGETKMFLNIPKNVLRASPLCYNYNFYNKSTLNLIFQLNLSIQQVRTTHIFKRRHEARVLPAEIDPRDRDIYWNSLIYDKVDHPHEVSKKLEPLSVILLKPIAGIGSPGQVVDVKRNIGRFKVIMAGLGVYASPENLEKYKELIEKGNEFSPSSPTILKTVQRLDNWCIAMNMNMENPWTIEPWHVRVALRRSNVRVPEEAITLPPKPISGPDFSLHGKEFYVKVKLNKKEEVRVRARVVHVATDIINKVPLRDNFWKTKAEPVFPEDAPVLDEMCDKLNYWVEPED